jgi:hypothetical protein
MGSAEFVSESVEERVTTCEAGRSSPRFRARDRRCAPGHSRSRPPSVGFLARRPLRTLASLQPARLRRVSSSFVRTPSHEPGGHHRRSTVCERVPGHLLTETREEGPGTDRLRLGEQDCELPWASPTRDVRCPSNTGDQCCKLPYRDVLLWNGHQLSGCGAASDTETCFGNFQPARTAQGGLCYHRAARMACSFVPAFLSV